MKGSGFYKPSKGSCSTKAPGAADSPRRPFPIARAQQPAHSRAAFTGTGMDSGVASSSSSSEKNGAPGAPQGPPFPILPRAALEASGVQHGGANGAAAAHNGNGAHPRIAGSGGSGPGPIAGGSGASFGPGGAFDPSQMERAAKAQQAMEASLNRAKDYVSLLRNEVARHNDLYYNRGAPALSDAAYDSLKQQLRNAETATGRLEDEIRKAVAKVRTMTAAAEARAAAQAAHAASQHQQLAPPPPPLRAPLIAAPPERYAEPPAAAAAETVAAEESPFSAYKETTGSLSLASHLQEPGPAVAAAAAAEQVGEVFGDGGRQAPSPSPQQQLQDEAEEAQWPQPYESTMSDLASQARGVWEERAEEEEDSYTSGAPEDPSSIPSGHYDASSDAATASVFAPAGDRAASPQAPAWTDSAAHVEELPAGTEGSAPLGHYPEESDSEAAAAPAQDYANPEDHPEPAEPEPQPELFSPLARGPKSTAAAAPPDYPSYDNGAEMEARWILKEIEGFSMNASSAAIGGAPAGTPFFSNTDTAAEPQPWGAELEAWLHQQEQDDPAGAAGAVTTDNGAATAATAAADDAFDPHAFVADLAEPQTEAGDADADADADAAFDPHAFVADLADPQPGPEAVEEAEPQTEEQEAAREPEPEATEEPQAVAMSEPAQPEPTEPEPAFEPPQPEPAFEPSQAEASDPEPFEPAAAAAPEAPPARAQSPPRQRPRSPSPKPRVPRLTTVGAPVESQLPKAAHFVPMLSLSAAANESELEVWRAKFAMQLKKVAQSQEGASAEIKEAAAIMISPPEDGQGIPFSVEPKIDGVAIRLLYLGGWLVMAATRGDGMIGEDVTKHAPLINGLPRRLETVGGRPPPEFIEVRGEVYMTKDGYEGANRFRAADGLPLYTNARNATTQILKVVDPPSPASVNKAERHLSFMAYQLLFLKPDGTDLSAWVKRQPSPKESQMAETMLEKQGWGLGLPSTFPHGTLHVAKFRQLSMNGLPETQTASLKWMEEAGLPVNKDNRLCPSFESAVVLARSWMTHRAGLDYDVDGVVIKTDSLEIQEATGHVGGDPRWAVAWKFEAAEAVTTLQEVHLAVGRTGAIIPVAVLEPVSIQGVTVSRATLHNFGAVRKLGLCVGDRVVVRRSGDVIPQVIQVVEGLRGSRPEPIIPPTACPCCGTALVEESNGDSLRCPSSSCPDQEARGLEHYALVMLKGLSGGTLRDLAAHGLVREAPDLYRLKKADLEGLKGWGEKRLDRLLAAIAASKTLPLDAAIAALGIPRVGRTAARLLAPRVGSLDGLLALVGDEERLRETPGIGPITAQGVLTWLAEPANRALVRSLVDLGVDPRAKLLLGGSLYMPEPLDANRPNSPLEAEPESDSDSDEPAPGDSPRPAAAELSPSPAQAEAAAALAKALAISDIGAPPSSPKPVSSPQPPSPPRGTSSPTDPLVKAAEAMARARAAVGVEVKKSASPLEVRAARAGPIEPVQPEAFPAFWGLRGARVVFTGTLLTRGATREEAERLVRGLGGTTSSTVSSRTDMLVVGDAPGSSKLTEALRLRVPIINEDEFWALVEVVLEGGEVGGMPGASSDS